MDRSEVNEKKKKSLRTAGKIILLAVIFVIFIAVYIFDSVFLAGNAIQYGKFGYCASIITLIMLAASFVTLCFAMLGKKRKCIVGIISAALFVLTVPALFLANTIIVSREYKTFDSAKWNDYNNLHCRQYMIDDLESRYKLVGMKIYDARELLGQESEEDSEQDVHKAIYDMGAAGVWQNIYVLEYDENGVITKTYSEIR